MRLRPLVPCLLAFLLLAGCLDAGPGEASEGPTSGSPTPGAPTPGDDAGTDPGADEGTPDGNASGDETQDVAFRTLATGTSSGHASRTREVIENATGWEDFWTTHAAGDPRAGERPQVDFATERVVAVVFGAEPPGCGSVRVTNATATKDAVRVEVTAFNPPPSEVTCGAEMRQPYHFIALPRGAPVTFVEREVAALPPS